ncbi:sulfite exporter TauE/SafE family protein [Lacticaseibacillus suihuaensis]
MPVIYLLYAVIILAANVLGAVVGMGGGVLIKPLLDAIGAHPLVQINFFSSVAVLTMAAVATWRRRASTGAGVAVPLGLGAVVGGLIGDWGLNALLAAWPSHAVLQLQAGLTILSLVLALAYSLSPKHSGNAAGPWAVAGVAVLSGALATLMGIGGGPINVALFMAVAGVGIKQAAGWSLQTILFSQLAKLLQVIVWGQLWQFDLAALWVIVPTAALGGLLGAQLSKRFNASRVTVLYRGAIGLVIVLNAYNALCVLRLG